MLLCGYGKILDVDLSTGEIERRNIPLEFAREFIGGMGFSCKILYDEVGTDVDPFSPDNIVVFANGPLTGTQTPCSGRTEITTKSPLTGNIGTGNTGGVWGAFLKHAGFDLIIVRKSSNKPVYLWIDDDVVELREANHIWGKDTTETTDIIKKELADSMNSKISVLTIGPAGENLVRYAITINDYHHCAARNGAGAVMGSKRLKAIAVRGTGTVKIARTKEFREAVRESRDRIKAAVDATRMLGGNPPVVQTDWMTVNSEKCRLPAKNYQTGTLPQWIKNTNRDAVEKYITKKDNICYACPIPCFVLAEVNEGKYADTKVNRGNAPGLIFDFGAKMGMYNLPAMWKGKEICQKLGLDYASAAGSIAFAMELFQREIINERDTNNIELSWGNEDSIIQMLYKITYRDGFGNILADGTQRAANVIGKGSEQYVMTTKGMEMMTEDPRTGRRGWAFGNLTNPRGGDNVKNTHFFADAYTPNWWIDKFDIFDDAKKIIYGVPPQKIGDTWEGKPMMCKWFEDLYSVINALGICFFPSGTFTVAIGPTLFSKLYSACTGLDTTPRDIMKFGEKVFTQLKLYNVRQGLTRKDDTFPDRFFEEPLPDGSAKGAVLSRKTIGRLLDEYYELRGWDKRTGIPSREKLIELGFLDESNELAKLGKLPGN